MESQAGTEVGGDLFAPDEPNGRVKGNRVRVGRNPQALVPRRTHRLDGVLDESACDTSSLPPGVHERIFELGLALVSHGHCGEAQDRSLALDAGHRYARAALGDPLAREVEELGPSQQQRSVPGIGQSGGSEDALELRHIRRDRGMRTVLTGSSTPCMTHSSIGSDSRQSQQGLPQFLLSRPERPDSARRRSLGLRAKSTTAGCERPPQTNGQVCR